MPRGSHGHILREKTSDSRILEKQEASVNPAFKQDIGPNQETSFLHFLLGVCFVSIPDYTSTLLYPRLSVNRRLRLGTGWEPPIRGSEMFERPPRPNLTDFFQFFCKKHMSHPFPWWNFFCGVQKFFLPPQMGHFLGGTDTFPKLRGRAVRGPLLYINLYALGST